ncbi:MAG: T9SS type A sorting domain-containing protein [Candidatus Kapaibacterium sp.]
MKYLIVLIALFLNVLAANAQYEFVKVHNEVFESPEERGFFLNLKCQDDTCVSINTVGGFAKIITSTNSGNDWNVPFTYINQEENDQYVQPTNGGFTDNYIYYAGMGGVITYSENSFTEFKVIKTPITYLLGRVDNARILKDTVYFTHSFDIFKKHLRDEKWVTLHPFDKKVIIDMEIDEKSNSIYCILNNIDNNSDEYELNERIFAVSRDMGYTWTLMKTGYDVRFITVNRSQIWLVGGEENGNGAQRDDVILLSTNSGVDWEVSRFKLSENSGAGLHGLKMKNDHEGIAYGNNGNFLRTTNAGQSWERLSINDEVDNIGFKPSIMVLDWNKYGEPILGISGMGIYIGKNETSVENFNLNEVTPQIFTNLLNINITEHNVTNELTLYSIEGRTVYQNELNYGSTTLDLSFLIPGVYFAKINNRFIRLLKQ